MDVRFYPSASGNPVPGDSATLDLPHCLGYYNYNKFGNNNNYMNMAEVNGVLLSAADQTFHTPSLGDEEFEIPPITPPPETDPVFGASEGSGTYSGTLDSAQPQHGQFTPQFPPQSVELPYITVSRSLMEQGGGLHHNSLPLNIGQAHVRQYHADPSVLMRSIINMNNSSAMMSQNHVTTVSQSQLSMQLGLNVTGPNVPHASPSPPASKSATPSPSSSINDEDPDDVSRILGEKRPAPDATKKPKTPKKKKKKDPNEPQKPVSAYALFFRDMQAAIKGQNPNATFGEVSKIVASMWDGLGDEQKQVYKSKTEAAKKDYLKALAAYRASLVSKAAAESAEAQAIRSVQQTLASTTLPTSLMLGAPMPQHTTQALQPAPPRTIAPKPLHLRLASDQIATSVPAVARSAPLSSPSQLSGQVGAGRTLVDGAPPSVGVGQMGSHLQVQQIHQPQMHFQHRLQHHIHQQLQQPHMQLQHMHMQQLHHHHHHHHHQSECPPPQRPPSGPQPVGSPQPGPPQQIQAHSQVLSQVSIY